MSYNQTGSRRGLGKHKIDDFISFIEDSQNRHLTIKQHQEVPDLGTIRERLNVSEERLWRIGNLKGTRLSLSQHIRIDKIYIQERSLVWHFRNLISMLEEKEKSKVAEKSTPEVLKKQREAQPPKNAKFLLYLVLDKNSRDPGLGDAIENFGKHVKMFGRRRAKILFYQEVARSAWPFVKRLAMKASGLFLLGKWLRKFIS